MSRREFSKSVKIQAFARAKGICENEACGAVLLPHKMAYDHLIPDALGGEPRLDNCQVLCLPCHGEKTAKHDVPTIAKAKRIHVRNVMGIKTSKQKIQSAGFAQRPKQRSASRPIQRHSEVSQ